MFQTGLLATFIPEVIMVLAFILCLLGPVKNDYRSGFQFSTEIVSMRGIELQLHRSNSSSVYHFEFKIVQAAEVVEQCLILHPNVESFTFFDYQHYELTNALSFVQFSRPPPSLFL